MGWTVSVDDAVCDMMRDHSHRVVSVSGGCDSVYLLFRCVCQAQSLGATIVVWTGHHGVRDDAGDDVSLVQSYCDVYGIECVVGYYDGPHTEMAMRSWRHESLLILAQEYDACVLLGHHMDDRIETTLFRLRKGTGLVGLCGIRPVSRVAGIVFIRPLLSMTKQAIRDVCQEEALYYHDDSTNTTVAGGQRNRIRHVLFPMMEQGCYDEWHRFFGVMDERHGRLMDSYQRVSLPLSPYRSGVDAVWGCQVQGVWTRELVIVALGVLGVYRYGDAAGLDELYRFVQGKRGSRCDYGSCVLWLWKGKLIVMRGEYEGWIVDGSTRPIGRGDRLACVGDKFGSQSLMKRLNKQGVPLMRKSSAHVLVDEDSVIVDCILPDEYVEWLSFVDG